MITVVLKLDCHMSSMEEAFVHSAADPKSKHHWLAIKIPQFQSIY